MTVQWGEDGSISKQQFQQWLHDLDRDIGRRIVLLIAPPLYEHCDGIKLQNVELLLLPSHIHAAKQPMERGLVRVFKILYSYEMMEVVRQYHREVAEFRQQHPGRSPRLLFPLDKLWRRIVPTWQQYLPAYIIRTCFIPVVAPTHKIQLSQTFSESDKDLEEYNIPALREDFQRLYPWRARAIEKNKDTEVTLYLHCCESGSYQTPMIESMMGLPEYRHMHGEQPASPLDEDEEYHSDSFDLEYI
ncbi:hypothetical protein BGZ73_004347 [Actinomortierella ambigua]|nr:hypothetical protein BGZ73_004347 [Actinomortierella ambigua]